MQIAAGGACAIVASGPSAAEAELEALDGRLPVLAVNDAWRLAPFAGALYACDRQWWTVHGDEVQRAFHGELWTQDEETAKRRGINRIGINLGAPGLSALPGVVHGNAHGGAQAINLAVLWGARRLILIGFDMGPVGGREHFFGAHPRPLRNLSPYEIFLRKYTAIAADLERIGARVWNASPKSRLTVFPRMSLQEALHAAGVVPDTQPA